MSSTPDAAAPALERVKVAASFLVIFAFSTIDSAMSPLVREIGAHFAVPEARVLWFISVCTGAVVAALLVGPALTASFRVVRLVTLATCGLVGSAMVFLTATSYEAALAARFVFGLSSGLTATCMWWLTFYGVTPCYYPAMVTVLMSARPLATAIGVPLVGLVATWTTWQTPLWWFVALIALGGLALSAAMTDRPEGEKTPFSLRRVVGDTIAALRLPHAGLYYAGFVINRMCYFGFYAMAGIWFIRHYALTLEQMSSALLVIGLAEAFVNFAVPAIRRQVGHDLLVYGGMAASAVLVALFINGSWPLGVALVLITLFMILDRIYCTAVIITIPEMFPQAGNKTVFGSLNTLTAWAGLTAISWFQGRYLDALGLPAIEWTLVGCFIVGSAMIAWVQWCTVSRPRPPL